MMQPSEREGRGSGHNYRNGGGVGGDRRGNLQQFVGGGRNNRGQNHRKEKEDGKNAAIEETKAMMAKMRMEEKEAIEKHKKEQAAVEKRRREKAAIGNNKPEKDAAEKQKKEKEVIEAGGCVRERGNDKAAGVVSR